MTEIIPYTSPNGRDLFCDVGYCECPSPTFIGTDIEHMMKKRIQFTGYNDGYFFDEVNKEPKQYSCKCGKSFKYQWKYEGVEITE